MKIKRRWNVKSCSQKVPGEKILQATWMKSIQKLFALLTLASFLLEGCRDSNRENRLKNEKEKLDFFLPSALLQNYCTESVWWQPALNGGGMKVFIWELNEWITRRDYGRHITSCFTTIAKLTQGACGFTSFSRLLVSEVSLRLLRYLGVRVHRILAISWNREG